MFFVLFLINILTLLVVSMFKFAWTSERLGIWYGYSTKTIMFTVFKQYMIHFEWNVKHFGQVIAAPASRTVSDSLGLTNR